jgi:hypothetical protein
MRAKSTPEKLHRCRKHSDPAPAFRHWFYSQPGATQGDCYPFNIAREKLSQWSPKQSIGVIVIEKRDTGASASGHFFAHSSGWKTNIGCALRCLKKGFLRGKHQNRIKQHCC